MKIFLVHNLYRYRGGVETVVNNTYNLLKQKNINVVKITKDSRKLRRGLIYKFRASITGIYSLSSYKAMYKLIEKERPDIAHIHNIYPLFSPSILTVFRKFNIPVVMTCHDYGLVCPQGQHLRRGRSCELCTGGHEYWCILKKCRKDLFESAAYALRNMIFRKLRLMHRNVTIFIALNQFTKSRLIKAGFDRERIFILPHMTPFQDERINTKKEKYVAYVGRISPEKGIDTIFSAAKRISTIPIKLAGDGPNLNELSRKAPPNVKLLGRLEHKELEAFYQNAKFLVVPSKWYEVFGMVTLEAMSFGLPVIASKIGGLPELVKNNKSGLLIDPDNPEDLAKKIKLLWENQNLCIKMGQEGKNNVFQEHSENIYFERIMKIYNTAIKIVNGTRDYGK
jgi:glycosyltransferase involved in cell wall biosynthesis